MIIPAFTLIGSVPCFYIIPVTAVFASAVARGEYPPHSTKAYFCSAPLERPFWGMSSHHQRLLVLRMFEAFKTFVPTNFTQLCRFSKLGSSVPPPLSTKCSTTVWTRVEMDLKEYDAEIARKGINKAEYIQGSLNYFVGSSPVFSSPCHLVEDISYESPIEERD